MIPCEPNNQLLHLPRARYELCLSTSTSGKDLAEMWPGCGPPNGLAISECCMGHISCHFTFFELHYLHHSNILPPLDQEKLSKDSNRNKTKTFATCPQQPCPSNRLDHGNAVCIVDATPAAMCSFGCPKGAHQHICYLDILGIFLFQLSVKVAPPGKLPSDMDDYIYINHHSIDRLYIYIYIYRCA